MKLVIESSHCERSFSVNTRVFALILHGEIEQHWLIPTISETLEPVETFECLLLSRPSTLSV